MAQSDGNGMKASITLHIAPASCHALLMAAKLLLSVNISDRMTAIGRVAEMVD